MTEDIAEADKYVSICKVKYILLKIRRHILEGLRKVGFKLTFGEDGAGLMPLLWNRLGGYYFGVSRGLVIVPITDHGSQMSELRRKSSMGRSS